MNPYVIVIDFAGNDGRKFVTSFRTLNGRREFTFKGSVGLTAEYPDAFLFYSRRDAVLVADRARKQYPEAHGVYVYTDYGLATEKYMEVC